VNDHFDLEPRSEAFAGIVAAFSILTLLALFAVLPAVVIAVWRWAL
jgi:hypothetical protein